MSSLPYRINPDDPRAPPQEVWDRMSAEERASVVASLPSEFPPCFHHGHAPPPEAEELINTLEQMVERIEAHNAELEQLLVKEQRLRAEEQRLRAEEQRLRAEEQQRREEAERKLAEALAELERPRGGRS